MSITCAICNTEFNKIIPWQHLKTHGISSKEYKKTHGPLYSAETLAKLETRVPHNKGKKVTDPAQLEKIKQMIAEREEKFRAGEIKRGTKRSAEQKQHLSNKQKEYAASNPDEMSTRAKKAIVTKKKRGYNFKSPMLGKKQSINAREKARETILKTNQLKSQKANKEILSRIELANLTLLSDMQQNNLQLNCKKCNTIFSFTKQYFHLSKFKESLCPTCYPRTAQKQSKGETELYEFVLSLWPDAIKGYRKTYHSKELDIYIPSLNIGIEFNGLYWHSETVLVSNNKLPISDFEKMKYFQELGIQVISIFEDEWEQKQDIVKSRLTNILKKTSSVIYARNCTVKEVLSKDASAFCNSTHIMGVGRSNVRFGLYYNNELISLMTFSKNNISRKNADSWEINRFSSKLNTSIVGGASKLFAAFIKKENPVTVLSYADNRWSDGNLYLKLGFKQSKIGTPNYWYIAPNSSRIHRFNLRKTNKDDQTLTEYENRLKQGYNRIWDCGSSKWEWHNTK
jgi:hypothetical protein